MDNEALHSKILDGKATPEEIHQFNIEEIRRSHANESMKIMQEHHKQLRAAMQAEWSRTEKALRNCHATDDEIAVVLIKLSNLDE